jgi:N-acetylglucosamine kinase-like BadF-type ATPase
MEPLFLGVDAGNSKTVAMLCAGSGDVLGVGWSGCGDIYGAPTEPEAVAEVFAAIEKALQDAGVARPAVASAAFRLAGVDWPEDRDFWDGCLAERWPELTRRSILNDGYAAIRCGEPSGVGVAVNAGTAGAIAARGPDGLTWDMGWWGQHALGALGLVGDALRAVNLAELGIGPPTALTAALLGFYGRTDLAELNQWLTRRHEKATQAQRLAAAHIVPAIAADGDEVARRIVDEQGRRLALYAEVAARRVGLIDAPVPVVLAGTVLMAPDSGVATATRTHLATLLPTAVATVATVPPVAGAALDAIAEAGIAVDADTAARIASRV